MTMTKAKWSSMASIYCSLLIAAAIFCGAYAAQAEGATFSSGMYFQGGLIAQWDGIDNVGAGTHNPDAKTWKDLVGTRDLALVSGKSAFADGNALECLSRSAGYAAGPAAVCPGYKTIEIVCTQKTGSGIAVIFSAGSGPRAILSEGAFAGTMDSTHYYGWSGNPATLAVTYDGNSPSNYYENATLLTATSTTDSWGYGSLEGLCVGGRLSTENHPYLGKVYAIRLYDRVLSQEELTMNAAIDAVRFFGADAETAIESIDLPDGYRWNATDSKIEVRVRASAASGSVSPTEIWAAVGEPVEFVFTPEPGIPLAKWVGCPKGTVYSADSLTTRFNAYAAMSISVGSFWAQKFTARSYVGRGLKTQFDGIDNAGTGTHNPDAAAWKDLAGTRDLALTQYGSFTNGVALYCAGSAYAAGPADAYTDYNTIELSCDLGSQMKYVFCSGDNNNTRMFAVYAPNKFLVQTGEGAWETTGDRPTMSATYSGATPVGHFSNGEAATKNGSDTWGGRGSRMAVGAGSANSSHGYSGNIYLIRLYDRALSQDELRFNAAIDSIRFDGFDPMDTILPTMTLPAGYSWDSGVQALFADMSLYIPGGSVSVTGQPVAAVSGGAAGTATFARAIVGETAVADFTEPAGATARRFVGLPPQATSTQTAAGTRATFTVDGPAYLALDAFDASSATELAVPLSGEANATNAVVVASLAGKTGVHIGKTSANGIPGECVGAASLTVTDAAEITVSGEGYAFLRPHGGVSLGKSEIVLGDGAELKLLADAKIADLMLVGESKIDLNGHVLTISGMQHKDRAGWDPAGAVVDSVGTGEIAWVALAGLMIIVK